MANDKKKPLTEEEKKKHIKKTLDEIEKEKKKVKKAITSRRQLRSNCEKSWSELTPLSYTSRVGDLLLPVEQSTIALVLRTPIPCKQSGYLRTYSLVLATS